MITERMPHKFHSRRAAFSFAFERCVQPLRLIHGDDDMFWVVPPADAARPEAAGYELAC